MPDLAQLLADVKRIPYSFGLSKRNWIETGGEDYYQARVRYGIERVPDVIGQVTAWGRVTECSHLPGVLKAERARVGGVLYLSYHLADSALWIQSRYPNAELRIGKAKGRPWLDEIATAEGIA